MLSNLTLLTYDVETATGDFLLESNLLDALVTVLIPGGEGEEKQMLILPRLCLVVLLPILVSYLLRCFGVILILISLMTFSFLGLILLRLSSLFLLLESLNGTLPDFGV